MSQKLDAKKRVANALMHFYDIKDMSLVQALDILEPLKKDLRLLTPDYQDRDDDYRLGDDTYGYDGDETGILHNLMYISDRWGCGYRMAWMAGLIDEGYGPGRDKILAMAANFKKFKS